MGKFVQKSRQDGSLVDTGGLLPSKEGFRIRLAKGAISVTDGPFVETKEVIGGWAILNANSRAEALRIAQEFMDLHRTHWPQFDGECEVRPMFESESGPSRTPGPQCRAPVARCDLKAASESHLPLSAWPASTANSTRSRAASAARRYARDRSHSSRRRCSHRDRPTFVPSAGTRSGSSPPQRVQRAVGLSALVLWRERVGIDSDGHRRAGRLCKNSCRYAYRGAHHLGLAAIEQDRLCPQSHAGTGCPAQPSL